MFGSRVAEMLARYNAHGFLPSLWRRSHATHGFPKVETVSPQPKLRREVRAAPSVKAKRASRTSSTRKLAPPEKKSRYLVVSSSPGNGIIASTERNLLATT